MSMTWNRPITIARGILAPVAGDPEQSPPGSGATITIYDSTLDKPTGIKSKESQPFGRIRLTMYSSHDSAASGVVFNLSEDYGAHWRQQSAQSYTNAGGVTSYDLNASGAADVQILYTNSANVLTAWEMSLVGIVGDRNPGS